MGYCVDVDVTDVVIPADKVREAKKAIRKLHEGQDPRRFSWVNANNFRGSIASMLYEWRWETDEEEDGSIVVTHFSGEKLGDDDHLWKALAPFVKAGGLIEWRGEDGDRWRYTFDGQKMVEQTATVSWE
jgi:hypothetical protein